MFGFGPTAFQMTCQQRRLDRQSRDKEIGIHIRWLHYVDATVSPDGGGIAGPGVPLPLSTEIFEPSGTVLLDLKAATDT